MRSEFLILSRTSIQAILPALCFDRAENASEPGRHAMGIRTAVAAGAALLLSGLAAQALESTATATSKLSADALWAKIGDFCGIAKWHPAVEKCELSADGKTRTLSLKGGGTIVEALVPRHSDYDMLNRNITATLAGVSDRRGLRCCERRPVAV